MKTSLRLLFVTLSFALLGSLQESQADEIDKARQSIRCSAIYSILTSGTDNNPKANAAYTQVAIAYFSSYGLMLSKKGEVTTNGEVIAIRDDEMKILANEYGYHPDTVIQEIGLCATWTENIIKSEDKSNIFKSFPSLVSFKTIEQYRPIANKAFTKWIDGGAITSRDVKEKLAQDIERSRCAAKGHPPIPQIEQITYHKARKQLLANGWKPVVTQLYRESKLKKLTDSSREKIYLDMGYTEVESCASAGYTPCLMIFNDGKGVQLKVYTSGEELPEYKAYAIVKNIELTCEK